MYVTSKRLDVLRFGPLRSGYSKERLEMTNVVYDTANVRACTDCVIAQENGDTSGMSAKRLREWKRGVARTAAPLIADGWEWSGVQCDTWVEDGVQCECVGDEHERDGWFSWSSCEWCGDTDGGQRFNVAIMRRIV